MIVKKKKKKVSPKFYILLGRALVLDHPQLPASCCSLSCCEFCFQLPYGVEQTFLVPSYGPFRAGPLGSSREDILTVLPSHSWSFPWWFCMGCLDSELDMARKLNSHGWRSLACPGCWCVVLKVVRLCSQLLSSHTIVGKMIPTHQGCPLLILRTMVNMEYVTWLRGI